MSATVIKFKRPPAKRPVCVTCQGRRVIAWDLGDRFEIRRCPSCNGRGHAPCGARLAATDLQVAA